MKIVTLLFFEEININSLVFIIVPAQYLSDSIWQCSSQKNSQSHQKNPWA